MNSIERFTQLGERQAPLLAFRRFTFNQGMETGVAAKALLDAAKALGLTEREQLYGNTLNDWLLPGGKPPMWAISGAMHYLETNGWQPSTEYEASDYAWWAYCKSKRFASYDEAAATIPANWPPHVRENAAAWLQQVMQIKLERQLQRQEQDDAV